MFGRSTVRSSFVHFRRSMSPSRRAAVAVRSDHAGWCSMWLGAMLLLTASLGPSAVLAQTIAICNEAALRSALQSTNIAVFTCDGTIRLTAPLVVSNAVTLDGGGRNVVLDAGCFGSSLILVTREGQLTLKDLTLTGGCGPDGAALRIEGGMVVMER